MISAKIIVIHDHLKFNIEDDYEWRKIEINVKHWMRENKKKIKMKLMMMYKKKWDIIVISSENENDDIKKILISQKLLILDIQKLYK